MGKLEIKNEMRKCFGLYALLYQINFDINHAKFNPIGDCGFLKYYPNNLEITNVDNEITQKIEYFREKVKEQIKTIETKIINHYTESIKQKIQEKFTVKMNIQTDHYGNLERVGAQIKCKDKTLETIIQDELNSDKVSANHSSWEK